MVDLPIWTNMSSSVGMMTFPRYLNSLYGDGSSIDHSYKIDRYLVGGWPTPPKNMTSSVGLMTFPINMESHNPAMSQTTNQFFYIEVFIIWCFLTDHSPSTSRTNSLKLHYRGTGVDQIYGVIQVPTTAFDKALLAMDGEFGCDVIWLFLIQKKT